MQLGEVFQPIRDWALDKCIIQNNTLKNQYVKFQEEAGELAKAINKNNKKEAIDAIGDIVVTLVSVAGILARETEDETITLESCIESAYEVIKNRTGKNINGDFIKDEERECELCNGSGFINRLSCVQCKGTGKIKQ